MEKIKIVLKDGSVKEANIGATIFDIANDISSRLAKEAMGGEVNGKAVGLKYQLYEDAEVSILTFEDEDGKDIFRHTSSHIMAQAVLRLFPNTKLAIGPPIENGFYYDLDSEHRFTEEDFGIIEKEMDKICQENLQIEKFEMSRDEAIKYMKKKNESYKVELIEDLPENTILSFYKQGEFVDLCAGPHLPSTKPVKAIKILSVAGAYWRGSEKNKMLQRIYATSYPKQKLLDEYLTRLEEAKKRDHRKLGKELDLFSIQEEGPGFPFFHPKGMVIRNILEEFWRKSHKKRGYDEVKTPIILNQQLWQTSGHWDHYKENMYFTNIDSMDYAVKPMNCPGSMLVYKRKMYSYRDFPIRLAEMGLVHRHELSGALHGLMRVRCFTQDDSHIFMLSEQIKDELVNRIDFIDYIYNVFGFKYRIELSTRPENSMGTNEEWDIATEALREALEEKRFPYKINEGDGAFYGPKIDFHLEDSIGRTWQCGTIQLDFQMPQRFELSYTGSDGEKHRPVMLHSVIYGSIERFIGILIEHFAGKFPAWIAPVQVKILPIADKFHGYAKEIATKLKNADLRVELDDRNEKIGYKIREAQLLKIPYMIIVGEKEMESNTISVRSRDQGELGSQELEFFIENLLEDVETRKI
ncbi:MAG: threonine--tRNA ligase [Alkaliphilus sp.]|nr:threonine--tRNA ligase [Alkaliphilus sp.]